jgi:hypothetical protein
MQLNTTPSDLNPKFYPYLIGRSECQAPDNYQPKLKEIFSRELTPYSQRDYIFVEDDWFLKLPRRKFPTTPDTHLYRVRKAEKIRRYIENRDLSEHFVVPKKYLYWHFNQFYVVAEKLELSDEEATMKGTNHNFSDPKRGEPCSASSTATRALSVAQATGLAELAIYTGLTDLSYNNCHFTPDGKIAIVDTEPLGRVVKEWAKRTFFEDLQAIKALQVVGGMAKLKTYCSNPEALIAVQKIERRYALSNLARLVCKIAMASLALVIFPYIIGYAPFGLVATSSLKFLAVSIAALKTIYLINSTVELYDRWWLSTQKKAGLQIIYGKESEEALRTLLPS